MGTLSSVDRSWGWTKRIAGCFLQMEREVSKWGAIGSTSIAPRFGKLA